ncbi:hypothetical protein AQI88_22930 [Streptomyces cellostaticus]|uniref:Uncharacterized protein n=1 Tax=Streptomyces cellostaticus TaxID=67285 RepID=A0A101NJJ9_9ACTN|nr:hypothetical protein [Streptomyces cellostaticus]KUM94227.1 hypothetical protein AQI88_22930 [Streptomyces cellostaticus]GHI05378.1 hypothetical protein Scel_36990 [Streptomyces cellostaticus]
MPDRSPTPFDVTLCAEELRTALALHAITLPSLRVDLPSAPSAGLVVLGSCTTVTARALSSALRKTAAE